MFDESRAIMIERYGQPTSQEVQPWQSKGGAKTTSTVLWWRGARLSIYMAERAGTIDEGTVQYQTDLWLSQQQKETQEGIQKGARDL
jgi:hypothetical protein